jgi:putative DNA primase/helicase
VFRAGRRFALVAAAGELATEAGITDWQPGQAAWAARQCFNAWLGGRGHLDNAEPVAMLRQVKAFITRGADRFKWVERGNDDHAPNIVNMAGFRWRIGSNGEPLTEYRGIHNPDDERIRRDAPVEYLIDPAVFRAEVCKGIDNSIVGALLRDKGFSRTDGPDRQTDRVRLPGLDTSKKAPVYRIRPLLLEWDEADGV